MVAEGILVWMTYLSLAFGKPLLFSSAQAQWERGFAFPNYTVARAVITLVWGLRKLVSAEFYRVFWEVPRPCCTRSPAGGPPRTPGKTRRRRASAAPAP